MATYLLKHLATSVTRGAAQMRWSTLMSSPAASMYRCLHTLGTAPRALLLSSARVSAIQSPLPSSSTQCPSIMGQCQHLPYIQSSAGMKTKTALKKRCKDCFFVRRRGHLFVFCKTSPKHKQRQG